MNKAYFGKQTLTYHVKWIRQKDRILKQYWDYDASKKLNRAFEIKIVCVWLSLFEDIFEFEDPPSSMVTLFHLDSKE